jgi:hypothetical protein
VDVCLPRVCVCVCVCVCVWEEQAADHVCCPSQVGQWMTWAWLSTLRIFCPLLVSDPPENESVASAGPGQAAFPRGSVQSPAGERLLLRWLVWMEEAPHQVTGLGQDLVLLILVVVGFTALDFLFHGV